MKDIELSNHLEESLEMLHALSEEGLVITPVLPTEKMLAAARKVCNLSDSEICKIYFAMTTFADEEMPLSAN